MQRQASDLYRVIEADREALMDLMLDGRGELAAGLYLGVRRAYLAADHEGLESAISDIQAQRARLSAEEVQCLLMGASMRRKLLLRAPPTEKELERGEAELTTLAPLWEAECSFLLAQWALRAEDSERAERLFRRSVERFQELGMSRKALVSRMNAIAAGSHADPDRKRLFRENRALAREAEAVQEWATAGTAYSNLSWEFERLGAHSLALKYIRKALQALGHVPGKIEYFRALASQSYLLLSLERKGEAQEGLEELLGSAHAELAEIAGYLATQRPIARPEALSPIWRHRVKVGLRAQDPLSELQEQAIDLMTEREWTRAEIAEVLYPRIPERDAYNRWNTLQNRLQEKFPGLIESDGTTFSIPDVSRKVIRRSKRPTAS